MGGRVLRMRLYWIEVCRWFMARHAPRVVRDVNRTSLIAVHGNLRSGHVVSLPAGRMEEKDFCGRRAEVMQIWIKPAR